jgi:hypothetical protein
MDREMKNKKIDVNVKHIPVFARKAPYFDIVDVVKTARGARPPHT